MSQLDDFASHPQVQEPDEDDGIVKCDAISNLIRANLIWYRANLNGHIILDSKSLGFWVLCNGIAVTNALCTKQEGVNNVNIGCLHTKTRIKIKCLEFSRPYVLVLASLSHQRGIWIWNPDWHWKHWSADQQNQSKVDPSPLDQPGQRRRKTLNALISQRWYRLLTSSRLWSIRTWVNNCWAKLRYPSTVSVSTLRTGANIMEAPQVSPTWSFKNSSATSW